MNDDNDVWSLDARGILTLTIKKNTYERLGMVGQKLPWKGCDDTYVIEICLELNAVYADNDSSSKRHQLGPKQTSSLSSWDAERGPWQIFYCMDESSQNAVPLAGSVEHLVRPVIHRHTDMQVPDRTLRAFPHSGQLEIEDWEEEVSGLFEWVGMACLGAQRLQASDRPDPYVAVYTAPAPSRMADITHVKWTGLLHPTFVQQLIESTISLSDVQSSLTSLTLHGVPNAPVAYLSSSRSSMRAPRPDAQDTRAILLHKKSIMPSPSEEAECVWILAESIGQWDARWG